MKSSLVLGPCRCTRHKPWSRPSASGAKALAVRQRSLDAQREAADVLDQSEEAGAMALLAMCSGAGWAIAWNCRTLPGPTAARYKAEQLVGCSEYDGEPWIRSRSCVVSEHRARPPTASLPSADRLQNASIAWLGLGSG